MRKDLFLGKSFQVYGPDSTAMACGACVYGRGAHESWCEAKRNFDYRDPAGLIGTPVKDVSVLFNPPSNTPNSHPHPGGKCCDDDEIRAGGCN